MNEGLTDAVAPEDAPADRAPVDGPGRRAGRFSLPIGVMLLSFAMILSTADTPRWATICFLVPGVAITLAGIRASVRRERTTDASKVGDPGAGRTT